MLIFLVGMPGSGKTKLGKKLANYLQYDHVDTDKIIECNAKKSIQDIFIEDGEAFFRKLELETIQQLLNNENVVISTGGGLPIFNGNMQLMKANGVVIYIEISTGKLASRIMQDNKRPMFINKDKEQVEAILDILLQQRESIYKESNVIIENEGDSWKQLKEWAKSYVKC